MILPGLPSRSGNPDHGMWDEENSSDYYGASPAVEKLTEAERAEVNRHMRSVCLYQKSVDGYTGRALAAAGAIIANPPPTLDEKTFSRWLEGSEREIEATKDHTAGKHRRKEPPWGCPVCKSVRRDKLAAEKRWKAKTARWDAIARGVQDSKPRTDPAPKGPPPVTLGDAVSGVAEPALLVERFKKLTEISDEESEAQTLKMEEMLFWKNFRF